MAEELQSSFPTQFLQQLLNPDSPFLFLRINSGAKVQYTVTLTLSLTHTHTYTYTHVYMYMYMYINTSMISNGDYIFVSTFLYRF